MLTTVNIDTRVLKDLKRLQEREGKSLGRLVSELLAEAIGRRRTPAERPQPLRWNITPGKLLADVADKEALYETVDAELVRTPPR